jgi:hypothetical protein
MTHVFLVVLVVFGLGMLAQGLWIVRRLRAEPPGDHASAVLLIGVLCVGIGVAAFAAATFRSPAAFWAMVGLTVALPVTRFVAGSRTGRAR